MKEKKEDEENENQNTGKARKRGSKWITPKNKKIKYLHIENKIVAMMGKMSSKYTVKATKGPLVAACVQNNERKNNVVKANQTRTHTRALQKL